MTTLDKITLLSKTKQDVLKFMDEYKIHECYKTKIIQFIKDCFHAEIDEKVISENQQSKVFSPQSPGPRSPDRSSLSSILLGGMAKSRPRHSEKSRPRHSDDWIELWDKKIKRERQKRQKERQKRHRERKKLLEVKNEAARVILNELWKNILTTFDLVVIKKWYEYDWSNMTEEGNTKNGLNIIFWIFRQIAVNFLLYFFALLIPNSTFKMAAIGSVSVTSDYDISISSKNLSAHFTRIFNHFFSELGETKTSGIIFDTNIYAHPIVEKIESEEPNNCYEYHKVSCEPSFLKAPNLNNDFLQYEDRIAAILMYYKYFGTTLINEGKLEYITYKFLKKNFPSFLKKAEDKYKQLKKDNKFGDGEVTNLTHQDNMNKSYEMIADEIQDIKNVMNEMCPKRELKTKEVEDLDWKAIEIEKLEQELMNIKLYDLLNKMTDLQFFGNETLLSVSAFLHVVVYIQELCTDHVFSGCRKTIINKENAKFIYLNSFIENLCFMTTHFKDIKLKGLKKIMKYLYRACDALVEYFNSVNKTPTEELIKIHKITKQWQQNKSKGEPEKMTENVKKLEKFMIEHIIEFEKKDIKKKKIKFLVTFLMDVFQDNVNRGVQHVMKINPTNYYARINRGVQELKTKEVEDLKTKEVEDLKVDGEKLKVDGGKKKKKKSKVISGGKKKKVIRKNKKKKVRK
ncbi:MAG: hypothetical protein VYA46_10255, partial [Verrucomicrobiota bacterium]|nr:hypothetical protein [Verrucomicrobiota bacterium]